MKTAATLIAVILVPLLGHCAALSPDAMSAFQRPGVPGPLYQKIEHGAPLTLADVVTLSNAQVSGSSIIEYLYSFGEHFRLSASDVAELERDGVRADLIDYMTSPPAHPGPFGF